MRYPQGGGLTAERRAFRERLRLEAVDLFAAGHDNVVVAKQLRVSVRSVQRWRRAWLAGGPPALRSEVRRPDPHWTRSWWRCWNRNWPGGRSRTAGRTRPGRWSGSRR
ncbi:helix-turn-helix domain-containing protein [Streptomyces sp. NPDC057620]|uniref:helix-turn-helix domain-containing protein n=1 Tax=Streptomyces sp. NPDC057620 TaxID=3346185 RepID=UPI0036B9068E